MMVTFNCSKNDKWKLSAIFVTSSIFFYVSVISPSTKAGDCLNTDRKEDLYLLAMDLLISSYVHMYSTHPW